MKSKYVIYIAVSVILPAAILLAAWTAPQVETVKKLKVSTSESKVNWMGKKPATEHKGFVKLSDGELLIENNEIKGGSFTIDLNTITDIDLKNGDQNRKLTSQLKSADFFDVKNYPTAKFVITAISKPSGTLAQQRKATHTIEGNLTIKGKTNKISFDASINLFNGRFTASTFPFTVDRNLWGINNQSKKVGSGLKDQIVEDDVTFSAELVSE